MAMISNIVTVTTSPTALHTAGPVKLEVRNMSSGIVWIGTSGAGNQKFPVYGGEHVGVSLITTDVIYAITEQGTAQVAVIGA